MYSYLNVVFFHKKHHVTLFFAFHFDSPKIRKAFFDEFQLESIAIDIEPNGFFAPGSGTPGFRPSPNIHLWYRRNKKRKRVSHCYLFRQALVNRD